MGRFDPDYRFDTFRKMDSAYPDFQLSDYEIDNIAKAASILGRKKNPIKTIKKLTRHKFMAKIKRRVSRAELDALNENIQRLEIRLNDLLNRRELTYEGIIDTEILPLRSRNPIQIGFGVLASIVMVGMAATIPSISALSLLEGEKFAALSDMPALAYVFGLTPLGAILASIGWKNTLKTDHERESYDRNILKATIVIFGIWLIVAALSAYPLTIGGQAKSVQDGFRQSSDAVRSGYTIGMPKAIFLLVTGTLDLVAAPALHILSEKFLFPKRKTGVRPDPERVFLDEQSIPAVEAEIAVKMEREREARFMFDAYDHACEAAIIDSVIRLKARLSDVSLARSHAVSGAFAKHSDFDELF